MFAISFDARSAFSARRLVLPVEPIDYIVARHMRLPHRWRDTLAPLDIEVVEPAVAVAVSSARSNDNGPLKLDAGFFGVSRSRHPVFSY
jgi:hypothetical protein